MRLRRSVMIKVAGFLSAFALAFQLRGTAYAMHISEGILPADWAVFWYGVSAVFIAAGLYRLSRALVKERSLSPQVALVGALIFVVSLLPVPVPISGSCSHPCGTPMGAILLGPVISILMGSIALLFQALFFAHGGITTWGANVFSMAVVGSLTGFLVWRSLRRFGADAFLASFFAGFIGDLCVYLITALQLALGVPTSAGPVSRWGMIFAAFLPTQLPLAVLEGLLSGAVVVAVFRRRPDMIHGMVTAPVRKKEG